MTSEFIISMVSIFAYAGVLMGLLQWVVTSNKYKKYRIRTPDIYRIPLSKKLMNIGMNMAISVVFFITVITLFNENLFHNNSASNLTLFGEVLAVLLVYDFLYYFMHRSMHHRQLMKHVHGVHHKARFPTSMESIYLHPVEGLAGLSLLMGTTALLGPVNVTAFLIIVFIHTSANILVHSNLDLPHPVFKLFNFWAKKHDLHHGKHLNKNYASIFPFWDLMFDTYA